MIKKSDLSLETLYRFKSEFFDRLGARGLFEFLEKKTFIRPNHITLFNWLIGVGAFYLLFKNHNGFVFLMILNFVLDNLDGYYARSRGLQSRLGECMDHIGDFVFGEIFMFKSWLMFEEWWIIAAMATFLVEALVIIKMGLAHEKFPSRLFLIFFIFGWYKTGLLIQSIYQPLTFLGFMGLRRWIAQENEANKV